MYVPSGGPWPRGTAFHLGTQAAVVLTGVPGGRFRARSNPSPRLGAVRIGGRDDDPDTFYRASLCSES